MSERPDDLSSSDWSVRVVAEAGPVLIALAHPHRLALLRVLHRASCDGGAGGVSGGIGALAAAAGVSRWSAWRHLRLLRRSGLVVAADGTYRLRLPSSPRVAQWLLPLLSAP